MAHQEDSLDFGRAAASVVDCSIIIPAFNAADFLKGSVTDALRQSCLTVEVLVIDDCSSDGTADVIAHMADPRLIYHRQEYNGGPARARNTGFRLARGRWVAILDADDRMGPKRLSSLITRAQAESLDLIADNLWVEDGIDHRLHIPEDLDGQLRRLHLTDMFNGSRMGQKRAEYGYLKPVFRRNFITQHSVRYNESMRIGEDLMLVAECLVRGARYGRVASCDYTYVRHEHSISHRLKSGQVEAMQTADLDFVRQHHQRLTPEERAAALAHMRSLTDPGAYIRMLDALKARSLLKFGCEVLAHPRAVSYFSEPIGKRLKALWSTVFKPAVLARPPGTPSA